MQLKLIHLYPDLMNLYGSYGNLLVLRRTLEKLGHTVELAEVRPGEALPLAGADMLMLGAGTERSALAALEALRPAREALAEAAQGGLPMLFCGTAAELLGDTVTDRSGAVHPALGLAPFTVEQGAKRIVGDVIGRCPLTDRPVVGFINKCSLLRGVETPFLTETTLGFGNEGRHGAEGVLLHHVIGSELTGPLLVKNPALLDWFAARLLERRGAPVPESFAHSEAYLASYRVTLEELQKR